MSNWIKVLCFGTFALLLLAQQSTVSDGLSEPESGVVGEMSRSGPLRHKEQSKGNAATYHALGDPHYGPYLLASITDCCSGTGSDVTDRSTLSSPAAVVAVSDS